MVVVPHFGLGAKGTHSSPTWAWCTKGSCSMLLLTVPPQFNWHEWSDCPVVIWDQGKCSSTYTFATASAAMDHMCSYLQNLSTVFSPQQILNCPMKQSATHLCLGRTLRDATQKVVTKGLATASTDLTSGCLPFAYSTYDPANPLEPNLCSVDVHCSQGGWVTWLEITHLS